MQYLPMSRKRPGHVCSWFEGGDIRDYDREVIKTDRYDVVWILDDDDLIIGALWTRTLNDKFGSEERVTGGKEKKLSVVYHDHMFDRTNRFYRVHKSEVTTWASVSR